MVLDEARWIHCMLLTLDIAAGAAVLDAGSSTEEFRTRTQPYIEELVFGPLRQRGITIVHVDRKPAPGVDVVADLAELLPETLGRQFDGLVCASLLEHVPRPERAAQRLTALVKPNGWLIITVPRCYRRHPDPIDTGFRPTLRQLAALFPGTEQVYGATIRVDERCRYAAGWRERLRFRIPAWRWRISCVVLRRKADA